jgi:hypothetical protein
MKRIVLYVLVGLLLLGAGGFAFYKLSPWPSVWLIRQAFAKGDEAARADAARFVPKGIRAERGLVYDASVADGRFDLFMPDSSSGPLPAIVWVYGGGFVAGSREGVGNYLQVLASRGYVGVAIDYTCAPTAKWPTPVKQTNAALAHILANADKYRIDPKRIFLMGDCRIEHRRADRAGDLGPGLRQTYWHRAGVAPRCAARRNPALWVLQSRACELRRPLRGLQPPRDLVLRWNEGL